MLSSCCSAFSVRAFTPASGVPSVARCSSAAAVLPPLPSNAPPPCALPSAAWESTGPAEGVWPNAAASAAAVLPPPPETTPDMPPCKGESAADKSCRDRSVAPVAP